MGERASAGRCSPRLDRIGRPDASQHGRHEGKEALYSTAPAAAPSAHLLVTCPRCGRETGLRGREMVALLDLPFVVNPVRRRLWTRCPNCEQRACLKVEAGPSVRAMVTGRPRAS